MTVTAATAKTRASRLRYRSAGGRRATRRAPRLERAAEAAAVSVHDGDHLGCRWGRELNANPYFVAFNELVPDRDRL